MENNIQPQPTRAQMRYRRLDRWLLHLLAIELGIFVLLILGGVIIAILVFAIDFSPDLYGYESLILWPVLPFIIALPLNMAGAFTSLVLNIRSNHQGYPGTGHLLNWIFLITTSWLFLLTLVFMLPGVASSY